MNTLLPLCLLLFLSEFDQSWSCDWKEGSSHTESTNNPPQTHLNFQTLVTVQPVYCKLVDEKGNKIKFESLDRQLQMSWLVKCILRIPVFPWSCKRIVFFQCLKYTLNVEFIKIFWSLTCFFQSLASLLPPPCCCGWMTRSLSVSLIRPPKQR